MVQQAAIDEYNRWVQAEKEEWEEKQREIDVAEATAREEEEARKMEEQWQQEAEEREEAAREKERLRNIQSQLEEDEHHVQNDELSEEEVELGVWDKYEREDYDSK